MAPGFLISGAEAYDKASTRSFGEDEHLERAQVPVIKYGAIN